MLKWFATLALLYAFLPIYGQEKGSQPATNQENPKSLQRPEEKSTPVTVNVISQQTPPNQMQGAKDEPKGYFYTLISANNLPTLLLVLVGIGGIVVALGTLQTIQRQTEATEKSAEAGLKQANHVVATERAWVTVEVTQPMTDSMRIKSLPENRLIGVAFTYRNEGRTPAIIEDSYVRPVFVECVGFAASHPIRPRLPDLPDYSIDREKQPIVEGKPLWMPRKRFQHLVSINRSLFDNDFEAFYLGYKVLCIYGFVQYRDATEGELHDTKFRFIYDFHRPGSWINNAETGESLFPPAFIMGGPDAYNQAT